MCGFEYCQWNLWWSLLNGAKYFWSPLRWLWVHGGAAVASSRNIFLDSATSNCIWVHSVAGRPAVLGLLFVWVSAPGWWWWLKKKHYDDTLWLSSFLLRFNWSSFSILTSKYLCMKYFLVAGGGADPGRQYRPETGARHWSCSCLGTQRSSDPAQHWSTNSQKMGQSNTKIFYTFTFSNWNCKHAVTFLCKLMMLLIFFLQILFSCKVIPCKNKWFMAYEGHIQLKYFLKFVNIFENL